MTQITLNIEGQRVKVDPSFMDLSPAEQEATVEEIAASLGSQTRGFMPQLNQGIAESAGGIVDMLNPFDQPHALNPFPGGTGSATTGLEKGMDAIGVDRATGAPQSLIESLGRGAGEAAGAAPFAGAAFQGLSKAPGVIGTVADDAAQAMNSARGFCDRIL